MKVHGSAAAVLIVLASWVAGIESAGAQILSAPALAPAVPTLRGEQLVPAAMGIRTDKQGNSWNIEQNGTLGRVGASMVNSGVQLLVNNNQQFYTYQPMMTADGKEFVLQGRQSSATMGLQMMRRIRLLEAEGIVRYLEIFSNTTTNLINLNVSLRTNFSGNYKSYLTNEGNSDVVMLGQRESAILVTPGSNQSNRAFLFSLCSPKSPLKPVISSQNKYGLTFQYNLAIPPGQTAIIAHAVSQVPVPRSFERKTLSRLFKPVALDRLQKTIPREFRPLIANFHAAGNFGADSLLSGTSIDSLGVKRVRRDVLAHGDQTRLLGDATCNEFKLKTDYGEAVIPFGEIAAVAGTDGGRRDLSRVFLQDGQVFSGEVTATDLQFIMSGGTTSMKLEIDGLDRLVRPKPQGESDWGEGVVAMIETFGGDRIAVEIDENFPLTGMTPWGRLEFGLDDILWLAPVEDEPVGHYVEFKDGSRYFLFLSGEELEFNSPVFGSTRLEMTQIRAAVTRAALERARKAEESGQPVEEPRAILETYVTTAGNQRIVGPVSNGKISVLSSNEPIEVSPGEIRRMVNVTAENGEAPPGGEGPYFRIELWGGGVMAGYIAENFVGMRIRDLEWQIPTRDIRELVTPVPKLSDEARQKIAQLIRQLGSVDWETRENATEELSGFGFMAKSILQSEVGANPDPEVQRRIERILASMQE